MTNFHIFYHGIVIALLLLVLFGLGTTHCSYCGFRTHGQGGGKDD